MLDVEIFFDKMTIVGNVPEELAYGLQSIIDDNQNMIQETGYGLLKGQIFGYSGKNTVYFEYDSINSKSMGKRNFRMEFNPSKLDDEQITYLKEKVCYILDDIAFSRLDLAIDVPVNMNGYTFEVPGSLKGGCHWGRNKVIETIYQGSRFSHMYWRLYNKKLELWEKEQKTIEHTHLWRLELEMKNSTAIEEMLEKGLPVLDEVKLIKHDIEDLPVVERVMVAGLLSRPGDMSELSKSTRAKYRKIIAQLGGEDIAPDLRDLLNKKTPELIRQINSWRNTGIFKVEQFNSIIPK